MLARLRILKDQYAVTVAANTTSTGLLLYITALIVEHVNLDQLAVDDDDVQRDIRTITEVRLDTSSSTELVVAITRILLRPLPPLFTLHHLPECPQSRPWKLISSVPVPHPSR